MKTFKQFLNESKLTIADDFSTFKKMVQEDCSDYLQNSFPSVPIFRGIDQELSSFIYSRIRLDRKPLNIPQKSHEELDELFEKEFNFKYRSGSTFASGYLKSAASYAGSGGVYVIFPENGYTFCGSTKVHDLWALIDDMNDDLIFLNHEILNLKEREKYKKISEMLFNNEQLTSEDDEFRKEMNIKLFKNLSYFESKNLKLYGKNEIMIKAKGFYGMLINDENSQVRSLSPKIKELLIELYQT